MNYTNRYTNSLNGVFKSTGGIDRDSFPYLISLGDHNVFKRMLVIDTSKDEIEVPMMARAITEVMVTDKLNSLSEISKLVIPLYINSVTQSRRTADSIIYEFFSRTPFKNRLQKVETNKGEIYYGNRGIILDKDFNPLIFCSMMCRKEGYRSREYMAYYKPIIHISPEVFNSTGLIHKSILKKVIPFYLSHNIGWVDTYAGKFRSNLAVDTKPQIIIDDVSYLIETPKLPTPSTCSNESLNKLLRDNIQDVLR